LVAGGHQQDRTVYERKDTSTPNIAMSSIAAEVKREVITMDIGGAYLHVGNEKCLYEFTQGTERCFGET